MSIGITIIATNAYFLLGVRFIKKFMKHFKGNQRIIFYFFSDTNPKDYLPDTINVKFYYTEHMKWEDGTNSKFKNVLLATQDLEAASDYCFYFDSDTNIDKDFTADWFLGSMVGGEHYGNVSMGDNKPYDRNPKSRAYIARDTKKPQTYYYGAFFGGRTQNMIRFCQLMYENQQEDKKINYEPAVNDESYINQHFHVNPPTRIVPSAEFLFLISDKGGLGETRQVDMDIQEKKSKIKELKDKDFDIRNNQIIEL